MVQVSKFSVLIGILFWIFTFSASVAEETEDREGGIVGTGIVGVIHSLGSIHVNGQVIEFPATFPIVSPLGARDAASLKPGETVVVEAVRQSGKWMAKSIRHITPLLGPASLTSDTSISILGADVIITPNTILQDIALSELADNYQWLAIDGLWKKDQLIASYIRKIKPRALAQVTASYIKTGINQNTQMRDASIGGVQVENFRAKHAKPGEVVTVIGTPQDKGLVAQTITRGLFENKLRQKLIEGFLSQPDETGFYTVYGSGAVAYASQSDASMPNERGIHCIIYDENDQIRRVAELPEALGERSIALSNFNINLKDLCF